MMHICIYNTLSFTHIRSIVSPFHRHTTKKEKRGNKHEKQRLLPNREAGHKTTAGMTTISITSLLPTK